MCIVYLCITYILFNKEIPAGAAIFIIFYLLYLLYRIKNKWYTYVVAVGRWVCVWIVLGAAVGVNEGTICMG